MSNDPEDEEPQTPEDEARFAAFCQRHEATDRELHRITWYCGLATAFITLLSGFVSWVDLRLIYYGHPIHWGGPDCEWVGPFGVLLGWVFLNGYVVRLMRSHKRGGSVRSRS
jgi:hypothetical protein